MMIQCIFLMEKALSDQREGWKSQTELLDKYYVKPVVAIAPG